MHEHFIEANSLTSDIIQQYQGNPEFKELTCFALQNDDGTHSLLWENGFRYTGRRVVDGVEIIVFKWFRGIKEGIEEMAQFFDRRAQDYDRHMRSIGSYETALQNLSAYVQQTKESITVLDLGCGTGAELEYVFQKAPDAHAVCIDLSGGMLARLLEKYPQHGANIETICGSYLGMDFGDFRFDYVIACNTLHHILKEDKAALYKTIRRALKEKGLLLISDYVASPEEESRYREQYLEMIERGELDRNGVYHIDLTLSYESEVELLAGAGLRLIHAERIGENGIVLASGR